jgi:hypothetical protein
MTDEQEAARERECIEHAIGIWGSGTELEHDKAFGMYYDGTPEWLSEDPDECDGPYRTVVVSDGGIIDEPKDSITDADGDVWHLVSYHTFSGEAECLGGTDTGTLVTRDESVLVPNCCPRGKAWGEVRHKRARHGECYYCGERTGTPHGYVHVGEGYEAIYRAEGDDE